jgi:hypothetical protein
MNVAAHRVKVAKMPSSERLPEAVRPVLALLLSGIQDVLGDQLVGLYLYGSLSSGDFNPASSDVDFVAVTREAITEDAPAFEQLREMHARIAASGLPFATNLEGSYISRAAWRRYNPADAHHPTIGHDWPFQIGFHDTNWVIERAIVRERGVVLFGPPPETLTDPVSPQQLRDAICQQLAGVWQRRIDADDWPRAGLLSRVRRADALPRALHAPARRVLLQAGGRRLGRADTSGLGAANYMGACPPGGYRGHDRRRVR